MNALPIFCADGTPSIGLGAELHQVVDVLYCVARLADTEASEAARVGGAEYLSAASRALWLSDLVHNARNVAYLCDALDAWKLNHQEPTREEIIETAAFHIEVCPHGATQFDPSKSCECDCSFGALEYDQEWILRQLRKHFGDPDLTISPEEWEQAREFVRVEQSIRAEAGCIFDAQISDAAEEREALRSWVATIKADPAFHRIQLDDGGLVLFGEEYPAPKTLFCSPLVLRLKNGTELRCQAIAWMNTGHVTVLTNRPARVMQFKPSEVLA